MKASLFFAVILFSLLVGQILGDWKWGNRRQNDVQLFRRASGDYYFAQHKFDRNARSEISFPSKFERSQFVITFIKHTDGVNTAHNVTVMSGGVNYMYVNLKIERRAVGHLRWWDSNDRAVFGMLEIYGVHRSCFRPKG